MKTAYTSIEEYIAAASSDIQPTLTQLRKTILAAAPDATEAISYQMPTFKLRGNLVHFAAYQHHIGFYPAPSGIDSFREELSAYPSSKGAIRFPIDKPLPLDLIFRIVQFRVQQQLSRPK